MRGGWSWGLLLLSRVQEVQMVRCRTVKQTRGGQQRTAKQTQPPLKWELLLLLLLLMMMITIMVLLLLLLLLLPAAAVSFWLLAEAVLSQLLPLQSV